MVERKNVTETPETKKKSIKLAKYFTWLANPIVLLIILIVVALIHWYISPTAINFQNPTFILGAAIYVLIYGFILATLVLGTNMTDKMKEVFSKNKTGVNASASLGKNKKPLHLGLKIVFGIFSLLILTFAFGWLSSAPLFISGGLSKVAQIDITEEGTFQKDVQISSIDNIPTIDRQMAQLLGTRKMGEAIDLVSQFEAGSEFTQIVFQKQPIRVSPVKYTDFFRYLNNFQKGLPYYITVDMVTGKADLVKSPQPIKYSQYDYFNRNVNRYAQMKYPTKILGTANFELDEKGTPFYVFPVISKTVGLFTGEKVKEVILINASTGEHEIHDLANLPRWVDRANPQEIVRQQINWYGLYRNGFWNSLFSKNGVFEASEGYNYIVLGDDLYQYNGLTSIVSDDANIGFTLTNSRTGEIKQYTIATATNESAMASAEGSVQEKDYEATYPLLLNMNNQPVFMLSLKDAAGLIKMYAFVDATNYQKIGVGTSLNAAWLSYNGGILPEEAQSIPEDTQTSTATITDMQSVVVEGNTYYYVLVDGIEGIFRIPITADANLPFRKIGDEITITYYTNGQVHEVLSVE